MAVHSSTPLSANLTTSVNLSFVYVNVNSGAENLFQILKDGVIIASGNNINTVVGNDQIYYYTLTVNSTSGGNYTFRDGKKKLTFILIFIFSYILCLQMTILIYNVYVIVYNAE